MGNYDNKGISRKIDMAPVYGAVGDRGSQWISSIAKELQGAKALMAAVATGEDQIIATLAKDPAIVIGTVKGPFTTTSTVNQLSFEFQNDGSDQDVTLSTATLTAAEAAAELNNDSGFTAVGTAFSTDDGRLGIVSKVSGITSQVETKTPGNNSAMTLFGFTVGETHQGDAKVWDAHRATLVSNLDTAVTEALAMVDLASNATGMTPQDDT